jgi:hypothetical protein
MMILSRFLVFSSVILTGAFATQVRAAESAPQPVLEDVSLDPVSGDTFIATVQGQNEGSILWLNDFNEQFEKRLAIPASATRTEIELNRPGRLSTLLQIGDQWVLTGFEKSPRGDWQPQSMEGALTGQGQASHLTTLPDGNLVVTVASAENQENEVLLVRDAGETAARYQVVERIAESRVAERAEALAAAANEAPRSDEPKVDSGNGLGFTAGLLSGVGIAYRRHFASRWGVQVGGVAFGDKSNLFLSVGVNVMRTLSLTQRIRFYAVFGASTFYSGSEGYTYRTDCGISTDPKACDPVDTGWQNSASLNFGAGIGMEFLLAKNLGLALELPITMMLDINDQGVEFGRVYPIPTGSLVYYF